ncbi:alpha/beta fold hydrolase [Brevundimonas sp. Root1423]|uniref:alpha/beta fold hydrolase n=1 Tax=Brevundimonas sp. Root1423 TaxID=1736462 RepID=UPI0006FB1AD5|nr:alpha/beta hydrolase [Brevundimonas sp. Root1423]KQY89790.1 alpha/beta hydrolase [Brevundimonas sp. Root1423]
MPGRKIAGALMAGLMLATTAAEAQTPEKPTIVLVHGAFADASSWKGVISSLREDGFTVIAAANPLRGVSSDASAVAALVDSINGPVVLVGHSYGGTVITNAARNQDNVRALVYVAAFAPDAGETAADLAGRFPGGTLGEALSQPVPLSAGGHDLYIRQDAFHQQFAHDVAPAEASVMAVTQRPITDLALNEPSGEPAWKTIPSWFVYGDGDKNIPAAGLAFMAARAQSRSTVVIPGGSHVIMISEPGRVADLIESASAP